MARNFMPRHNVPALLDHTLPGAADFTEILTFLRRSRISHAITADLEIYYDHIHSFWNNISYDCRPEPPVLRSIVNNQEVTVSVDTIREILQFPNDGGRTVFPAVLIRGCFERMNYRGNFADSQLRKPYLSHQWRYLMHVLISCLSSRKAGTDGIGQSLQSAMVALTLNKQYNFGQFVFDGMVQQVNATEKFRFLLYPRFIQMILNHLIPDLPRTGSLCNITHMDKRIFADCKRIGRMIEAHRPINTPLFGHLINELYVEPANDLWINPNEEVQQQQQQAQQQQHQPQPQPPQPQQPQAQQQEPQQEPQPQVPEPPLQQEAQQQPQQQDQPHQSPSVVEEAQQPEIAEQAEDSETESDALAAGSDDDDSEDDDSDNENDSETERARVVLEKKARVAATQSRRVKLPARKKRRRGPLPGSSSSGRPQDQTDADVDYVPTSEEQVAELSKKQRFDVPAQPTDPTPSTPVPIHSPEIPTSPPPHIPTTSSVSTPTVPIAPTDDMTPNTAFFMENIFVNVSSPPSQAQSPAQPTEESKDEQIASLQATVNNLTNEVQSLTHQVAELHSVVNSQAIMVSDLTATSIMQQDVNLRNSQMIQSLTDELQRLYQKLSAQGESSCKEAVITRRDPEDKDPDAPSGGEHQASDVPPTMVSLGDTAVQGESSSRSDKGKQVVEETEFNDEDILDCLKDLDGDDWIEDLDSDDDEVNEVEIERGTEGNTTYLNDEGIEFHQDIIEDLGVAEEIEVEDVQMEEQPAETTEETTEPDAEPEVLIRGLSKKVWEERRKLWFKEVPKTSSQPTLKSEYISKGEAVGRILSWFFDDQLNLFAIKRTDGVQYLKPTLKAISSLPDCEVRGLAQRDLINRSDNGIANVIARTVRTEGNSNKFVTLKPQKGKRVKNKKKINPLTNKPWIKAVYKPVKCEKNISLRKYPMKFLDKLKWWYVDGITGEAVMIEDATNQELARIYDPMCLINFAQKDLKILHQNRILYHNEWKEQGLQYQRVVDLCVKHGIHAGSHLPSNWKES